jgi:hypothetical protein
VTQKKIAEFTEKNFSKYSKYKDNEANKKTGRYEYIKYPSAQPNVWNNA